MAIYNPPPTATPTTHHTTHETGGADALTTVNAGIVNTGTLPDAQLSTNIPRLNAANTFTTDQVVSYAGPARWNFVDTVQAANSRNFVVVNTAQQFYLTAALDNSTGVSPSGLILDRAGNAKIGADLYEKTRTTPIGHWIDVPFNAANFSGQGGLVWTVTGAQVTLNRYTLVGKTLVWTLRVENSTLSGTMTTALSLQVPSPYTLARLPLNLVYVYQTAGAVATLMASDSTTLGLTRVDAATYSAGGFYLRGTITLEIA